ncbi:MAG: tetratricopeptide repeat protein, partial [Verrucomicrobiota bacterium]
MFNWFRKKPSKFETIKARAEEGDPEAQRQLGIMLAEGMDVPRDTMEAARWFRKAAEQGDRAAQYNFAIMHSTGS